MAKTSVAKRSAAVESKKWRLTVASTSAGRSSACGGWLRKQACRFAMSSAAGTPLPETSPSTKPMLRPGISREELLLDVGGSLQFALAAAHGLGLFADGGQEAVVVPRLLHAIAGAAAHGFHGDIDIAPRGHDDDGHGVALGLQAGQQVHAFLAASGVAGVIEVGEDQVERAAGADGVEQSLG